MQIQHIIIILIKLFIRLFCSTIIFVSNGILLVEMWLILNIQLIKENLILSKICWLDYIRYHHHQQLIWIMFFYRRIIKVIMCSMICIKIYSVNNASTIKSSNKISQILCKINMLMYHIIKLFQQMKMVWLNHIP